MEALDHPSFRITASTSWRKGPTYSECVAKSNRACVRTYRKFFSKSLHGMKVDALAIDVVWMAAKLMKSIRCVIVRIEDLCPLET